MQSLRALPIKRKLLVVILLTCTAALLLASAAFVAYDLVTFRRAMIRDLAVLANVIGNNTTAALSFSDPTTGAEVLGALKAHPHIVTACLYTKNGQAFARYSRADAEPDIPAQPGRDGQRFEHGRLVLFQPVMLDNKRIGTIYLHSDMRALQDRIRLHGIILVLVIVGALLAAIALSTRLQRVITQPLLSLAATVQQITAEKNYTVRAKKLTTDEIGLLTDGINGMLAGIEERDVSLRAEISERRRAEEELRKLNETLEQRVAERTAAAETANRAKSDFLANMSHELRTPLNSVIGFTNILLKNKAGNLRPEDLAFLERIVANGRHLLSLINQILDLSKIEAGKIELELTPVALDSLVRETIAQHESQVRDKPVKLLVELPATLAPLHSDAQKLKQVIINLISNALKFTEQGSVTVRVVADRTTAQPIRIDVADTGIGIPKEKMAAVFDAFQQADSSTSRRFGGTGLGLTISRALCQLMGYRIEVRSKVGQGSTFSVILKAPPEAAGAVTVVAAPPHEIATQAAAEPPAAAPPSLKDKLVLVIDDEADARMLLTHMIEEYGCKVIAASSGEQGLRMAREFQPDLITLDLLMPEMDGRHVLARLRDDPQLASTPVVVVSVVASENRGINFGVVDILDKPTDRADLQQAIQRNLRRKTGRVMIVEDNPDDRHLMALALADAGCELRLAGNGREALALLERFAPDVIVLDLMMPEMDGLTFLTVLRSDARYRQVPVLVATAKDLSPEDARRLQAQTRAVLRKSEHLEANLKGLLQGLLRSGGGQP